MADSISFHSARPLQFHQKGSPLGQPLPPAPLTETENSSYLSKRFVNVQLENHWSSLLRPRESGNFSFTPVQLEAGVAEYGPASLRGEAVVGHAQWQKSSSLGQTEVSPYAGAALHLRHTANPKSDYKGEAFQPNFAGLRLGAGLEVSRPLKAGWTATATGEFGFESSFSGLKPMPYALQTVGIEKTKRTGNGEVTFGVGLQHTSTPLTPSSLTPVASLRYTFR